MKLFRLWLPQVNIHGDCFDKLCQKCQAQIDKVINEKLVLPTNPGIVIDDDEVILLLGYSQPASISGTEVIFCKDCTAAFKRWIDEKNLHISNAPIELWISNEDEVRGG